MPRRDQTKLGLGIDYVLEQSAVEQSAVQQSAVQQSAVERSAVQQSAVQHVRQFSFVTPQAPPTTAHLAHPNANIQNASVGILNLSRWCC